MRRWPRDEGSGWNGAEARMVFRVLEIPWEGATSHELFERVMGWLEAEEEGRRGPLVRRPEARMGEAEVEGRGSQLTHE
jgi:hypothetical protein